MHLSRVFVSSSESSWVESFLFVVSTYMHLFGQLNWLYVKNVPNYTNNIAA